MIYNIINRRGILQYAGVIKVWTEKYIYINNDNLPTPENILVTDKETTAHIIFNENFVNHLFFSQKYVSVQELKSKDNPKHFRKHQCSTYSPTYFELFTPKPLLREVFILQTNKNMAECELVCGSLQKPLNISRAITFGSAAQLISSRKFHNSSMT